ncbi:MAG: SLBB domain-containing protein [Melioribacteraceae bacterium]|nr:SLBB domain-containing protein [Melioribacteraceae bacterium]
MKKILILILVLTAFVKVNAQDKEDLYKRLTSSSILLPITVTIGGNFVTSGTFGALAAQRVDHFVTQIFITFQKESSIVINTSPDQEEKQKGKDYSLRDITLKRSNGQIIKVDLLKFRMTGDYKYNPYLANEDVLIFPAYNKLNNYVEIMGAVNKSTKFQYVEGDRLSDAILFAGGLNLAYDNLTNAEVSRINENGKEEVVKVSLNSDFMLKRGDRINVLFTENFKQSYKALVLGEVKNPGFQFVSKDGTPLKNVIEKVGGFFDKADLKNAIIIRYNSGINKIITDYVETHGKEENKDLLKLLINGRQEMKSMQRLSNLSDEDSIYFFVDNYLRVSKEEKLVDFVQLKDSNSEASNFLINDGDVLIIPEFINKIYVFGQVPRPGYYDYESNKELRYYVDQSGGLTENSKDYDEVVLIKSDSREWITGDDSKGKIEAGDFVYVPKDPPRTFTWYLNRVSLSAGIIGSVATVILLINQLGK